MGIEFSKLNHITINAPLKGHEKIRWFYGEILGLEEIPIPKQLVGIYDIIWYKFLGSIIHVEFSDTFVFPTKELDISRHLAVDVKDIKKTRAYLKSQGIEIFEGVDLPDRDRFYIKDPFGNVFEIVEMKSRNP